jgi:hypothetical protein
MRRDVEESSHEAPTRQPALGGEGAFRGSGVGNETGAVGDAKVLFVTGRLKVAGSKHLGIIMVFGFRRG